MYIRDQNCIEFTFQCGNNKLVLKYESNGSCFPFLRSKIPRNVLHRKEVYQQVVENFGQGHRENSEALEQKEYNEAPCELNEQKLFRVYEISLENYCWFTL